MGMISDSFHRLLVGKRDDTIPVLAAKLNISAAKLYAKMNPYDQEHDLKMWEAEKICRERKDYTPFVEYLEAHGFKVTRLAADAEEVTEANCLLKAAEIGAACGAVADICVKALRNDGKLDTTELTQIVATSADASRLLEKLGDGARKAVLKAV